MQKEIPKNKDTYKTNKYDMEDIFLVLVSINKGSLIQIKTIKLKPKP